MSKFRTVEVSDNNFECNNLRFITAKSFNLKGRGDICTFVPPVGKHYSNLPIIILLHGVYGSSWSWSYRGGVHIQAQNMIQRKEIPPMIIAMPSDGLWGDGSAYLPHNNLDFEKWIVSDVPDVIKQTIPEATAESPLFIGGLSMGGFGALRIGAKYGKKFMGISAHSSITSLEQMKFFVEEKLTNYEQSNKVDEDVLDTILQNNEYLPPLRFDCGVDDKLIEHNRRLHRHLRNNNIDHIYEEFSGEHNWNYWKEYISKSLLFFAQQL